MPHVIAIDGPAGAGKTTISKLLCKKLGYTLIDTGALYRGTALRAREKKIRWDDDPGLAQLIEETTFEFRDGLVIDGCNRESEIRGQDISMGASDVSKLPEVRAALLPVQREFAEHTDVVMEGRDIGTVVFPDADLKVFLTASLSERARRRAKQLGSIDFGGIRREIKARDDQDSSRDIAPLRPSQHAIIVDTTHIGIKEVGKTFANMVKSGINGRWGVRFIELAEHIAGWSKDPSTKVGCVIVGPNREIRSTGFNGFPRGVSDDARLHEREHKYAIICHAEENAITHAARTGVRLQGCTAYVTWPPCTRCARSLIQSGVSVISYPANLEIPDRWKNDLKMSTELLSEAGIHVLPIVR